MLAEADIRILSLFLVAGLAAAPPAQATTVDRIAAVVNDEVIALSEVYALGGPFIEERCKTEQDRASCERQGELEVLDSLILKVLIRQELTNLGMGVNAAEIDRTVDQIGRDNGIEDREAFKAAIEQQGMTWAAYREQLTDQIRQMKFNETVLRPRITVTDDEVLDQYNRTVREFEAPPVYELEAIGIRIGAAEPPVEEGAEPVVEEPEEPEAGLVVTVGRAGALAAQLNAGTLEWADAVATHDTLGRGGKMGRLKLGEMSPAIEAAVSLIEAGQVTQPVVMGELVFLIRLVNIEESGVLPFEEVGERIRRAVFEGKIEDELEQWYQQTRREASLRVLLQG